MTTNTLHSLKDKYAVIIECGIIAALIVAATLGGVAALGANLTTAFAMSGAHAF
jgi:Flp pilus assembly pilin Flp